MNDDSVCILFKNSDDVRTAFFSLTGQLLDEEDPLKPHKAVPSLEIDKSVFVRLALASDVKEVSSLPPFLISQLPP